MQRFERKNDHPDTNPGIAAELSLIELAMRSTDVPQWDDPIKIMRANQEDAEAATTAAQEEAAHYEQVRQELEQTDERYRP